jgi:membrane protein required for beta-lactamase induction
MKLLALLLGLGVERLLTHFFHLREFRWLDPLFELAFRRLPRLGRTPAMAGLALLALVLTAPVLLACLVFAQESQRIAAFLLALVVLLFSLGPRDLQEETAEFCEAVDAGKDDDVRRLTREITEREAHADSAEHQRAVERAIYVQANNRIFGVVFWFLALGPIGPAGAWLFRVTDLMRRRAAYARPDDVVARAVRTLHGWLAWLPARLMAAGFALAGNFEGARGVWRLSGASPFYERTETLVGDVGQGARADGPLAGDGPAVAALARSALALVRRSFWLIWYPVIALLTLNDWLL